ncbi:MAG TPA: MarR family transcriptional regulator [Burkholderiales bacterium]|nr:MarR family transcriptional regulator [Burkholderiales bacterium]
MSGIYDPKHYDVHNSVAYLMGRVRVKLHEAVDRELAQYDITTAQWVVMLYVANGMADKASEICALQSYDPGAMTRMIDRLEQKGFIRRVPSPSDRRVVNLELTPEGKAAYPKILAAGIGVLNRFLRGFSKTEVHQMKDFLKRMLANA